MTNDSVGVAVPKPQIPKFWRDWLYELNPFTRLSGMIVTELRGRQVHCTESELLTYSAPFAQTCGSYMESYFQNRGRGYLEDNNTMLCKFCTFKMGDDFYTPLGLSYDRRWTDLGIYACFIFSNLVILFVGVGPSLSQDTITGTGADIS